MRIRPISAFTLALSNLLVSCGPDSEPGQLVDHSQAHPRANEPIPASAKELRAAYIESVQQNAGESYAGIVANGSISLHNDVHQFVASADREGLILTHNHAPWHLALRTVAVGCNGARVPVADAVPEAAENRVRYARRGLEEWYLNGPLGLEQGYVLHQAPACSGFKTITVAVDGDVAIALDDPDGDGRGESAQFLNDEGQGVLGYGELFVKDASGKTLPAWLSVDAGELSIAVDDTGAKYPITIDPLVATDQAKLIAADGAPGDGFGYGVAIDGDVAVVGVPWNDTQGAESGAAYVYRRNGAVWALESKLSADDGQLWATFGMSVAISSNTIVVGAPQRGPSGAAYVFVYNGSTWTQQTKIAPADGAMGDSFGRAIAISGDTAIIGSPQDDDKGTDSGSAYVFTRNAGWWSTQAKLTASDGSSGDYYGGAVAISTDGNTVVMGASKAGSIDQGASYVYVRNGTTWTEQATLSPSDGVNGGFFGRSVAVGGDTIVVGSPYSNNVIGYAFGEAYVFMRNGTTWTEQTKLFAPAGGAWFGYSVALSGDLALIGDPFAGVNVSQSGAVYAFYRADGTWPQISKIGATDGGTGDQMAMMLGASGSTLIVGSVYDDVNANQDQGSANIFELSLVAPLNIGTACLLDGDCSTGFCVDGVCCDSPCADTCMACSAVKKGSSVDGVCGSIAYDTDPDNECYGGACDGKNVCKFYNGVSCAMATACLSNYCVDGYCCGNICMGECVACSTAKKGGGYDGVCEFVAANTNPSGECNNGGVCNGSGTCSIPQTKAVNGAACTSAAQCESGYCADGVCCDSWCLGTCQACTAAKKGNGADGVCGPIPNDTDPENECFGGSCNGQGACKRTNGTICSTAAQCSSGYCVDSVCCDNVCNGGCEACSAGKKGTGVNGTCEPIAAGKDPENECEVGECNGSGACNQPQTPLPNGTVCVSGMQCASGFCVDGFCCDSACTGECQACSAAQKGNGADGTCGNIQYDTDPDEECWGGACTGDGACKYYNGLPCTATTECLSNYCVDGYCCGNICTGTCSACSTAKKGTGFNGVCEFIGAGTDPDGECPASSCNGSGACTSIQAPARIWHVSVPLTGTGANGASDRFSVSDDGRYVAFLSAAQNLVADDSNGYTDVFLRDMQTGTTTCVSRGAATNANGNSFGVVISGDGDKIAFLSMATNIVNPPSVPGQGDAYVYSQSTGMTTRISPLCSGACNNEFWHIIYSSKDGSNVVFATRRPLVESPDDGEFDVFRVNATSGAIAQVSLNSTGGNGTYYWGSNAFDPLISSTGRYVGFRSAAKNLDTPELTVPTFHSYVKDMETGVLTRVSKHSGGDVNCDAQAYTINTGSAFVSTDGNVAVFDSSCAMMVESGVPDTNNSFDIFLRNIALKTTRRLSVSTGGVQSNGDSYMYSMSEDARYVLFWSVANNLVPDDTNGAGDLFLHDTVLSTTSRVSLGADNDQIATGARFGQLSHDGRFMVMLTTSNLLPTDTNVNTPDVYLIQLR